MITDKHITIGIFLTTAVIGLSILLVATNPGTTAQAQSTTSFTFTAAGDHANGSNFRATLDQVRASGASFHVAVGDNSYSAGAETSWCNEFNTRGLNAVLIAGNHDTGEGGGGNIDIYKTKPGCTFPFGSLTGNYGHQYYFDYPQTGTPLARFILIRPGVGGSGGISYGLNQPGYNFTRDAIDSARALGIKWVIVGMHKNCISTGSKPCEIGSDIFRLFIDKKVDLILQGHDHNYQRSHSLSCFTTNSVNPSCIADNGGDGQYAKGVGSVLVITGTGGQGLYGVSTGDSEAGYFAAINSNTHGATKFIVDDTQLQVNSQFLRSAGGTFTDSFTITDCPTCPSPTPQPSPTPLPVPDLIVTDISWTPQAPVGGDAVTFQATIRNQGTQASPQGVIHGVRFSVDGVLGPWSDTHTTSLPPGGSVSVTASGGPSGATWTATPGTHTITANVDDVNRIIESDETNNTFNKSLPVGTAPTPTPPPNPTATASPTPSTCPIVLPTTTGRVSTSITLPATGAYRVWSRMMAANATNDSYYLQVDDQCPVKVGDVNVPTDTWKWVDYQEGNVANKITLPLASGTHIVTLVGNELGVKVAKLYFTTNTSCVPVDLGTNCTGTTPTPTQSAPTPTPPPGRRPYPDGSLPKQIPGTIQAEDYDIGGEGVSYHDTDGVNQGGAYRSDGVDVKVSSDTGP